MKWLVASDIHGSAFYCEELMRNFEAEHADRLLLLGDLLYHGPRNDLPKHYDPKRVAEMLNRFHGKIMAVRGNCDSEVDGMLLHFPILADYACIDIGVKLLFATHGHIYHENHLPPLSVGDILLYGHTHVPAICERDGILCLNPGSVSIPKNCSEHGYILFENGCFQWKNMQGKVLRTLTVVSCQDR